MEYRELGRVEDPFGHERQDHEGSDASNASGKDQARALKERTLGNGLICPCGLQDIACGDNLLVWHSLWKYDFLPDFIVVGDDNLRVFVGLLLLFQVAVAGHRAANDVGLRCGVGGFYEIGERLVELLVEIDGIPGHA